MFMSRRGMKFIAAGAIGAALLAPAAAYGPESISISPSTFDFGWCPDNSKINAEFTLKNTGSDLIPLTGVQPTCGCTASQFTPGSLATNDESKVLLTFNTRGYGGTGFSKTAKVKTDNSSVEYTVGMTGFVTDPAATVFPDQGGIAGFTPESKEKSKTINIQNKSAKDVTIEIVQRAASWATVKLQTPAVKAGASTPVEISAEGPYDQNKETSVTFSATDGTKTSRFTIAIRTGQPPAPMHRPEVTTPAPEKPADKPATKPASKPAATQKKK